VCSLDKDGVRGRGYCLVLSCLESEVRYFAATIRCPATIDMGDGLPWSAVKDVSGILNDGLGS
jgi:hypothetical protein